MGLRPVLQIGYTVNMRGERHRKHGGGLGGTTADSILALRKFYGSDKQFIDEQLAFALAVRRQELLDQTLSTRVLGKPRNRGKRKAAQP